MLNTFLAICLNQPVRNIIIVKVVSTRALISDPASVASSATRLWRVLCAAAPRRVPRRAPREGPRLPEAKNENVRYTVCAIICPKTKY